MTSPFTQEDSQWTHSEAATMTDRIGDIERFRAMLDALGEAVTPRSARAGLLRRTHRVIIGRLQR
jgi:hypothetical protein